MAERFILFCGRKIKPWIYTDEPFEVDRQEAIKLIVSGEVSDPTLIMAFDLPAGTCRDATHEILSIARELIFHEPLHFDHQAAAWDHARDARKNEVA